MERAWGGGTATAPRTTAHDPLQLPVDFGLAGLLAAKGRGRTCRGTGYVIFKLRARIHLNRDGPNAQTELNAGSGRNACGGLGVELLAGQWLLQPITPPRVVCKCTRALWRSRSRHEARVHACTCAALATLPYSPKVTRARRCSSLACSSPSLSPSPRHFVACPGDGTEALLARSYHGV